MRVDISPHEFELETLCPLCTFGLNKDGSKCSCCSGTGMINTPLGEHILSFVCRRAKAWRNENPHPGNPPYV